MSQPPSNESSTSRVEEPRQPGNKAIGTTKDSIEKLNKLAFIEKVKTLLTPLSQDDLARQERRRIYQELGQVLATTLDVSESKGLLVSYYLIGREDLSDLSEGAIIPTALKKLLEQAKEDGVLPAPSEALLEQVRNVLVQATIQYTNPILEKPGMVHSVVELYTTDFTKSPLRVGRVAKRTKLDRDVLPPEIREALMRGDTPVTYLLFPQERG